MNRLSRAGFKSDFVRRAILPDWWDETCTEDPTLLQDIEIRVGRFLGQSLATIEEASLPLAPPPYPEARLRRVRDLDRDRLGPAIHSAIRIAEAVVRSLQKTVPEAVAPPADGLAWRKMIARADAAVTLGDIVSDLWKRGIPVVQLDVLPTPRFQGLACIVESRPVILLGHKQDEPGRVAFLVAHEAGHVASGDCRPGQPVIDEEEEITDDADIERRADVYATQVLAGGHAVPEIAGSDFRELAHRAADLERTTGTDASSVIFTWARRTGDYATATMAVKALYRAVGARKQLRQAFDRHVDLATAAETDRALLRCIYGEPERNEATG